MEMRAVIVEALEKRYEAQLAECDATIKIYLVLIFPLYFFAFSFAIASIVLDTDNFASGNNTFDNASKTLYVSFVKETFLYLLISVMIGSFHIVG